MLAKSGTQGESVLVGLVESEFCLGQVACVPIPVAFGLVPCRFDWILLWSLFSIDPPLEKPYMMIPLGFSYLRLSPDGDLVLYFTVAVFLACHVRSFR